MRLPFRPSLETLEIRENPALTGFEPNGVFLNPTLLTDAFNAPPQETTTDLYQLDQRRGFSTRVVSVLEWKNYSQNWDGANEKWVWGNDGWYYLLPQGKIFRWTPAGRGL